MTEAQDNLLAAVAAAINEQTEIREGARATVEAADAELERLGEVERVLSRNGDAPPPSAPPELKPKRDAPPPAQHQPSQAPAEAPSRGSSRAATTFLRRKALLEEIQAEPAGSRIGELAGSRETLRRDLAALRKEGKIRMVGTRSQSKYFPADAAETPGSKQEVTVGEGTPEGRVLEYATLNPRSSGPAIALGTGISLNEVRPLLGNLMREGMLRSGHKGGETVYTGTP